jgi:hypothetical protein
MEHSILIESFGHALMIATFVFAMMVLVDYLNVLSKGGMNRIIRGGKIRQYSLTSFLGSIPGCLGAFTNVSFYTHGLISFGAIVGGMIATSGDEAFIMIAMFPKQALILFLILFILGITGGWATDKLVKIFKIRTHEKCCEELVIHEDEKHLYFGIKAMKTVIFKRSLILILLLGTIILMAAGIIGPEEGWNWIKITFITILSVAFFIFATVPEHYLKKHIWEHIVKKHLLKIFLWSLFAILFVHIGLEYLNLEALISGNMLWIFIIAALLGVIPESGPHLIIVMMFAQGLIPFSVLLVSSIVQDGHGMLPMLSYSVKDSVLIKIFNLFFGLLVGGAVYLIGF